MTAARALGLLGMAYLALLLGAVAPVLLPPKVPLPDTTLLVALHAGLTCRLGGSAVTMRDASPVAMVTLGLLLGYLQDLVSGAPRGLHALALGLLLLLLRSAASHLLVRGVGFVMAVSALVALGAGALVAGLRAWVEPELGLSALRGVIGQAAATALLAPLVFALLRRIDARLWRDPRARGLSL